MTDFLDAGRKVSIPKSGATFLGKDFFNNHPCSRQRTVVRQ